MSKDGDGADLSLAQAMKLLRGTLGKGEEKPLGTRIRALAEHPLPLTFQQWEILCYKVRNAKSRGDFNGVTDDELLDEVVKLLPTVTKETRTIARVWLFEDSPAIDELAEIHDVNPVDEDEDWHDLLAIPEADDLLEGVIPTDALVLLYGDNGSAKSFCAIDWAHCLQAGVSWPLLPGSRVQKTSVVYVALEGAGGMRNRIKAWIAARGGGIDPKVHFRRHLFMYRGEKQENWEYHDGYNAGAEALVRKIKRLPKPRLLCFDTLAYTLAGGNENSTQDVSRLLTIVRKIMFEAECSVLLIHHENASGGLRGSTALPAAADIVIRSSKVEGQLGMFKLSWEKRKEGELDDKPLDFSLRVLQTADMKKSSAVPQLPLRGQEGRVLRAMKHDKVYSVLQLEKDVNKGVKTSTKKGAVQRLGRNRITECLEQLKEWGYVEHAGGGKGRAGKGWKLV